MSWNIHEMIVDGFPQYYYGKIKDLPEILEKQEIRVYFQEVNSEPILHLGNVVGNSFFSNVHKLNGLVGSVNQRIAENFGENLTPREESIKTFSLKVEQLLNKSIMDEPNWTEIKALFMEVEKWSFN